MIIWRLNELMAERRLSGKELADLLNVHPNTVSRLRKDNTMPSVNGELLEKLCLVLQCTPTDLIKFVLPEESPTGFEESASAHSSITSIATQVAIAAAVAATSTVVPLIMKAVSSQLSNSQNESAETKDSDQEAPK